MNRQIGQEKNGPAENKANTNLKSFALHHLNNILYQFCGLQMSIIIYIKCSCLLSHLYFALI